MKLTDAELSLAIADIDSNIIFGEESKFDKTRELLLKKLSKELYKHGMTTLISRNYLRTHK